MKGFFITLIAVIVLIIVLVKVNTFVKNSREESHQVAVITKIQKGDYTTARELINQYYKNDEAKREDFLKTISEKENSEYKSSLKIPDGWEYVIEGDVSYVRAKVKNSGEKTINFFKIRAKYQTKDFETVSTDTISVTEVVSAKETKDFVIKHKHSPQEKTVKLYIDDVSILSAE